MNKIFLSLSLICAIALYSCMPETKKAAWTETCFEDFADGSLDAGGNLYVTAEGSVAVSYSPDLNNDGWPDVIFSNGGADEDDPSHGSFYIYWGGPDGFVKEKRTLLPQTSSHSASIGDLNNDGWQDLVVNGAVEKEKRGTVFTIFLGSEGGFTIENSKKIPLIGAFASCVADLDRSGFIDVVIGGSPEEGKRGLNIFFDLFGPSPRKTFLELGLADFPSIADLNGDNALDIIATRFRDADKNSRCDSYIVWNRDGEFDVEDVTMLPSYGGHGSTVADLNSDGHLDLIFNNFGNYKDDYVVPSTIFWGTPDGFDPEKITNLTTMGACESSVADLNADGHMDLFFANWAGNEGFEGPAVPSYIYWGSPDGYTEENRTELPSVNGVGGAIVDFDKDSHYDILINNTGGDRSFIYWGGENVYSVDRRSELESYQVFPTNMRDFGDIYDRKFRDAYLSSVFDACGEAAWLSCTWKSEAGEGNSVEIYLRVGPSETPDEEWSDWKLLENGADIEGLPKARYAQYKAVFNYANFSRPALSEISFYFRVKNTGW